MLTERERQERTNKIKRLSHTHTHHFSNKKIVEHPSNPNGMQLLFTHRDLPLALCSMLVLNEIAPLYMCCRAWRDWLNNTQMCLRRGRECQPSELTLVLFCGWVRRAFNIVRLQPEGDGGDAASLRTALFLLSQVPRMESIGIDTQVHSLPDGVIEHTFQSLPRLSELELHAGSDFIEQILQQINRLRALKSLQITSDSYPAFDFSQLAALPVLETVKLFRKRRFSREQVRLRLSREQTRQIATCEFVTELSIGELRFESLTELIQIILARPSRAAAVGREPVALQLLECIQTPITSDLWGLLSQLTDLESLGMFWVVPTFQDADYVKFRNMHKLLLLDLTSLPDVGAMEHSVKCPPPLPLEVLFPSLPPSLLECTFGPDWADGNGTLQVTGRQLALLVEAAPNLHCIKMSNVFFDKDGLGALSGCQNLTELVILHRSESIEAACHLRVTFPILSELQALRIDDFDYQLSASTAAPLTELVLSRCPKLAREDFSQTLRDE